MGENSRNPLPVPSAKLMHIWSVSWCGLPVVWCLQSAHLLTPHAMWSSHTHFCLPLTSRQHPVVPAERRPAPALWPLWDNTNPGLVWQAAGCFSRTEHTERRETKAGNVGGFTLPAPQKPGEKKEHFLPLHPRWLASFPPPPSLQQTNIAEDEQTHGSVVMMTRLSSLKKRFRIQKTLQKNLRAHSCTNINEHIDSLHIQDTYSACCWGRPALWSAGSTLKYSRHKQKQ